MHAKPSEETVAREPLRLEDGSCSCWELLSDMFETQSHIQGLNVAEILAEYCCRHNAWCSCGEEVEVAPNTEATDPFSA
jgi:hypothetical protein